MSANTIATANIILTGTTGVDGAITVSATDKKLQIENRYGQTVKFYINVLQHEDAYFAI